MILTIKKFNKYYEETTIKTRNLNKIKQILNKENNKLKNENYIIEIIKNYFIDKIIIIVQSNNYNLIKIYEIKPEFKDTINEINEKNLIKNINYKELKYTII